MLGASPRGSKDIDSLMALVADPKTTKARLAELRKTLAAVNEARKALDLAQSAAAETAAKIEAMQAELDQRLAAVDLQESQSWTRKKEADTALKRATADAAKAAELREKLEAIFAQAAAP